MTNNQHPTLTTFPAFCDHDGFETGEKALMAAGLDPNEVTTVRNCEGFNIALIEPPLAAAFTATITENDDLTYKVTAIGHINPDACRV